MTSTELRIGNLVEWNNEIGIISQLFEMEVVFKCGESDLYTALKPIPLTEEWLLKFGFKYDEDEQGFLLNGFHLENRSNDIYAKNINKEDFGCWFINSYLLEIKFVHQLQNLYFSLTGRELTVA